MPSLSLRLSLLPFFVLGLLVAAGLSPSLAAADIATVRLDNNSISLLAKPGQSNSVTLSLNASNQYVLSDSAGAITAEGNCWLSGAQAVCSASGVSRVVLDLGDGNDSLSISASVPTEIYPGPGNDTINGGSHNDLVHDGPGDDVFNGGNGNDHFDAGASSGGADIFYGGNGTDIVDYRGRPDAVSVSFDNLANDGAEGERDDMRGDNNYIYGGDGNDTLRGNNVSNLLEGGPGNDSLYGETSNDTLRGGPGSDLLVGGDGSDTAEYSERKEALQLSMDGAADDGAAGEGDNLMPDFERLVAGSGADTLRGGPSGETLVGNSGDDRFLPSPGADRMEGGSGWDTLDYSERAQPLTVSLDNVSNDGESGEADNARSDIDAVIGGNAADTLTGHNGSNLLSGGADSDRLLGMDGNDTLDGGADADTLDGGGGADALLGGLGSDSMRGGSGTDLADYSDRSQPISVTLDGVADDGEAEEDDVIESDVEGARGGRGADRLVGNSAANPLYGGPGADRLDGGEGSDALWGEADDDTLLGGAQDDALDGGAGQDTLNGGSGADNLAGGADYDLADYSSARAGLVIDLDNGRDDGVAGENDNVRSDIELVRGGTGDDRISGNGNPERIEGGAGEDVLTGNGGDDVLEGAEGDDVLDGSAGADTLVGEDGADVLGGGDGDDRLEGGANNDRLNGGNDQDRLEGGEANDHLAGENGSDQLHGGEGDDKLEGGDSPDVLAGDSGDDKLEGGNHDDTLDGGNDKDVLSGGAHNDAIAGGAGDDVLLTDGGSDRLAGGEGWDSVDYSARRASIVLTQNGLADDGERVEADNLEADVERMVGGSDVDTLEGGPGPNQLEGNAGDDFLRGGGGEDRLYAGAGNDTVDGGEGQDRVDGGEGRDMVDYLGRTSSVIISLGPQLGGSDHYSSVEGLIGSDNSDTLHGSDADNQMDAGAGNDNLRGYGGSDTLSGGPGVDTADYAERSKPVRVTLDDRPDDGGENERDNARSDMEHITGGSAADRLTGNNAANRVQGGAGSDRLVGAAGADRLEGGEGDDRISGGSGTDRLEGGPGSDLINAKDGRRETVRCGPGRDRVVADRKDKLKSCERRLSKMPGTGSAPKKPRSNGSGTRARTINVSRLLRPGKVSFRSGIRAVPRCKGAAQLKPTWVAAARQFNLRWKILAAITQVESGFGCNMGPSSAGALGWTQFMPATWKRWGTDADGDGKADPYNSVDAIYSTARYLRVTGAPRNYYKAIFAYNHADWYVKKVLAAAKRF